MKRCSCCSFYISDHFPCVCLDFQGCFCQLAYRPIRCVDFLLGQPLWAGVKLSPSPKKEKPSGTCTSFSSPYFANPSGDSLEDSPEDSPHPEDARPPPTPTPPPLSPPPSPAGINRWEALGVVIQSAWRRLEGGWAMPCHLWTEIGTNSKLTAPLLDSRPIWI